MIPSLLLFSPFQKGYVQAHTRKGKRVGPYFTKRQPGQVQEKHTRDRFIDHDKASASKAHEELESLKAKHQELLNAAKKHHDEIKSKGPVEGERVDHKTKLSHLKAEIKNQKTHIDNHSRKQKLIKDRYKISSKQITQRKSKSDLERKIASHSDGQKKTIRAIHEAHKKGESKLEPGRILKGKDKDHIYLETKHKDTGEAHHIAIHKDGSVKDPNILHGGKFDSKTLKEDAKPKKIVVKSEPKKGVTVKKQEPFKKVEKSEAKKIGVKKQEEKKQTRSQAMKGNKNAWKGGPKDEPKKVKVKTKEGLTAKTGTLTSGEKSSLSWYSGDGFHKLNEYLRKDNASKNKSLDKFTDSLNSAISKSEITKDTTLYRGINNDELTKKFQSVKTGNKIPVSSFQSTSSSERALFAHAGLVGVALKINVKKGTNIADLAGSGTAMDAKEQEILLPNKGHYVVKSVSKPEKGELGRTIVEVDYIQDEQEKNEDKKTSKKVEKSEAKKIVVKKLDQEKKETRLPEIKKGHYIKRKISGLGDRPSPWEYVSSTVKNGFMVEGRPFTVPFSDIISVRTGNPALGRGDVIYDDGSIQSRVLKKSIPTTSKQLENLLQEERLFKSLKSPEEIKLLKEKRKRRKKRKNKR